MSGGAAYKPLASEKNVEEGEPPKYEEVELTPAVATPKEEPRCLLRSSFFCLSIPAGVRVFAIMDLIAGLMGLVSCVFIAVLRSNEGAVDLAVEHELEHLWGNSTNSTLRILDAVSNVNHGIHVAAHALPFLVVTAFITIYFAYNGLLAANGCVKAAKTYYVWKMVGFVFALFCGSFFHIICGVYAYLIVRSHYIQLNASQQTLPHHTVVVVQQQAPMKQQPPAKTVE